MTALLFHVTDAGPKRCSAAPGACPFGGQHFSDAQEAQVSYETTMAASSLPSPTRRKERRAAVEGFSREVGAYYGAQAPMAIQLEALNGVVAALEEEPQTQLVAACGTGKTYMGRQLMRHFMEQEDSTGIAVVLTSSIKLAQDTAADMRPSGGYDHSFGDYGRDYEVIEVHSDKRLQADQKSVLDGAGAISAERIKEQIEEAQAAGKKVVLVSTYDSSRKVQQAQALLGASAEADIVLHDEAHNILGQQRPTTVTEAENTAYTGFHNSIPGAIQTRRRLYATATPVVQEEAKDKASTGTLEEAIEVAQAMEKDPYARVTFYSSDTSIVGGVGGYISQHTAISAGNLARPDYQLRDSVVRGDARHLLTPAVAADGTYVEATEAASEFPMTPQTYSAVSATLTAMVADGEPGKNPSHNALAYLPLVDQAKAFKEHFPAVAFEQSGRMELDEAQREVNSEDPALRRRARLRLLGEYAEVKAAHSRSDSASKREKEEAFAMFHGRALTEEQAKHGWSPHKRVLANVDIFSEGVNIPEIDTVVMAHDNKTTEKAMTQAIGRAIRTVRDNPYKATGHVIIPRAVDESGRELTGGSAAMAAYGATRVERGVAIAKLQGRGVQPDTTTLVTSYSPTGEMRGTLPARELASSGLTHVDDLVAVYAIERVHQRLRDRSGDESYAALTPSERHERIKSELFEDAQTKKNTHEKAQAARAYSHLQGKSASDVAQLRKGGRVVFSALAAGDMSALPETIREGLVRSGHIVSTQPKAKATLAEKRAVLAQDPAFVAAVVAAQPLRGAVIEGHAEAREAFFEPGEKAMDVMKAFTAVKQGKSPEAMTSYSARIEQLLKTDDSFVERTYGLIDTEETRGAFAQFTNGRGWADKVLAGVGQVETVVHSRDVAAAAQGTHEHYITPESFTSNGVLKSSVVNQLARLS